MNERLYRCPYGYILISTVYKSRLGTDSMTSIDANLLLADTELKLGPTNVTEVKFPSIKGSYEL